MNFVSMAIIPLIVLGIVIYGYSKKVSIYDSFLEGAKEGLMMTFKIFPTYIAMLFAVNVFVKSNFLEVVLGWLQPMLNVLKLPIDILPMVFLRPISGSAVLALLNDVFTNFGPDSFAGRLGSTIMGCTDTTFYILALYFGSVGISKTKHAVKAGLFADLCGIIAAFVVVYLFFGN